MLEIFTQLTTKKIMSNPKLAMFGKPAIALSKQWLASKSEDELKNLFQSINEVLPAILDDSVDDVGLLTILQGVMQNWKNQPIETK